MTDTDKKFHPYDKDSFEKLTNKIKKLVKEREKIRKDKEILERQAKLMFIHLVEAGLERQSKLIEDENE